MYYVISNIVTYKTELYQVHFFQMYVRFQTT